MEKRARVNSDLSTAGNGNCVDTSKDDDSTLVMKLYVMMIAIRYIS